MRKVILAIVACSFVLFSANTRAAVTVQSVANTQTNLELPPITELVVIAPRNSDGSCRQNNFWSESDQVQFVSVEYTGTAPNYDTFSYLFVTIGLLQPISATHCSAQQVFENTLVHGRQVLVINGDYQGIDFGYFLPIWGSVQEFTIIN